MPASASEVIVSRCEKLGCKYIFADEVSSDKKAKVGDVLEKGTSMMNRIDFLLSEILGLPVRKADRPAVSMMIGCDNAAFVSEAGLLKMLADENTVRFCCAVRNFSLNKL